MSHPISGAARPAPATAAAAAPTTAAPKDTSSFVRADEGAREAGRWSADSCGMAPGWQFYSC